MHDQSSPKARKWQHRCAVALALCVFTVAALRAQEYSFRNFAAPDGLGNLSIQKLYQDRSGFIWASTEDGLFRYDGSRVETFGAAHGLPAVASLAFGEAPDGTLLIGSKIGLYHLAGSRFEKLNTPFKAISWVQGIESAPGGRTFLATELGLYLLTATPQGFAFQHIGPSDRASSVYPDHGALWFGCGSKLCSLDTANRLTTYGSESGLPADSSIVTILRDRAGNLWLRARNEGVFEIPGPAQPGAPLQARRPDTPLPGASMTGTPGLDRAGHILLGTADALLLQTDHGWQIIDRRTGLRGGAYTFIEDHHHGLWIGTGGRGITLWHGYREWEGYTGSSGLPSDDVYEILPQSDGTLYVATEGGLSVGKLNGGSYSFSTVPGTAGVPVHTLQATPSGDILVGTASRAIAVLHPANHHLTWYTTEQGLAAKRAFTIRIDRAHHLWAATDAGVYTAEPPYNSFTRVDGVPASWFWTVTESQDGTVWAAGMDGLFALRHGRWLHFDKASGLTDTAVTAVGAAPDGSVWIGYQSGGGIDRAVLTPQSTLSVQHNLQRPGTDGLIYFLNFDHAGHLWAGTERGLDRWDGAHWSHFDTTDGLIWDDLDIGGFASTPDGTFYFGTAGGLAIYHPQGGSHAAPPDTLFTDLHLGNMDVLNLRTPSFPFDSGSLIAHFAAPTAEQDSSLLFRYRLEGPGSPWTETSQRQLELARLAPGSYTLEVEARDNSGLWSPHPAVFAFKIRPPFYRRWWFVTTLILLPFLALAFWSRVRVVAGRVREQRLRRLVDARTAELRTANEELLRLTMQDALTGLANRRRFDQALAHECDRVNRSGATVSLILIDVDHFKALNDTAGHPKGDEYLVTLSRELSTFARRKIEVAARIGGEEFALLLPATSASEAARIAEDVRRRVEDLCLPHPASPSGPCITVSLGVATAGPGQICTAEHLVATADQALYRAKSSGRNRVEVA